MLRHEIVSLVEENLEMDAGSLNESMVFDEIENWDSLAVITTIAVVHESTGVVIPASEMKNFKTVKDLVDFVQSSAF